jgi:hypothetical protein
MLDRELHLSYTYETTTRSTESSRDEINAPWAALDDYDVGFMKH